MLVSLLICKSIEILELDSRLSVLFGKMMSELLQLWFYSRVTVVFKKLTFYEIVDSMAADCSCYLNLPVCSVFINVLITIKTSFLVLVENGNSFAIVLLLVVSHQPCSNYICNCHFSRLFVNRYGAYCSVIPSPPPSLSSCSLISSILYCRTVVLLNHVIIFIQIGNCFLLPCGSDMFYIAALLKTIARLYFLTVFLVLNARKIVYREEC